jgi:hypothetical protein
MGPREGRQRVDRVITQAIGVRSQKIDQKPTVALAGQRRGRALPVFPPGLWGRFTI